MLPCIWPRYHCCRGAGRAYRLIVVCLLWIVSYVGICRVMYHAIGDTLSILVGIRAIGVAAFMPNWLLCCVVRATTSLENDVWWRWWQNRRNKTRRQVFLHDGTSCINWSWPLPLSYGHHGAPLLAFKHTAISQHTMEQVYVVKTRKNYH